VRAMREAVGDDIDIMVDCHARPSPAMGMRFGMALEPYGLYFFEEPCWPESLEGLADIRAALTTPVATGERLTHLAAFRDLFAAAGATSASSTSHTAAASARRTVAALAEATASPSLPTTRRVPSARRPRSSSASRSRAT
jgi:galactonate dehydratase